MTVRRPETQGQIVEVKTPITRKDYENMLNHADQKTLPVYKTRRSFMHNNQQFHLDIYRYGLQYIALIELRPQLETD
jgi:hypothetical protein